MTLENVNRKDSQRVYYKKTLKDKLNALIDTINDIDSKGISDLNDNDFESLWNSDLLSKLNDLITLINNQDKTDYDLITRKEIRQKGMKKAFVKINAVIDDIDNDGEEILQSSSSSSESSGGYSSDSSDSSLEYSSDSSDSSESSNGYSSESSSSANQYYIITGTVTPDVTLGYYIPSGMANGQPYYSTGTYYLFWHSDSETYRISNDIPANSAPYNTLFSNSTIEGNYEAGGGATGTATVTGIG